MKKEQLLEWLLHCSLIGQRLIDILISRKRDSRAVYLDCFWIFRPYSRHFCPARGACALPGDVIPADHIPIAADKCSVAMRAVCVFIFFHMSGQIPGIHVIQPGLAPDLSRSQQRFRGRIIRAGHLVVFVKSGYMPGNICRNGTQETGGLEQFIVAVVESRHDQRHHFHP